MGPGLQSPHQATVLHQVSISWPVEPLLNTVIMCNYLVITDTHMKLSCRPGENFREGSLARVLVESFLWRNKWFLPRSNQWTKYYSFMWGYDVMTRWWWWLVLCKANLLDLTPCLKHSLLVNAFFINIKINRNTWSVSSKEVQSTKNYILQVCLSELHTKGLSIESIPSCCLSANKYD